MTLVNTDIKHHLLVITAPFQPINVVEHVGYRSFDFFALNLKLFGFPIFRYWEYLMTFHILTRLSCVTLHVGFTSSNSVSATMQEYLESNSEIFVHQEDDARSVTESPHIIQDIFVMDRVQPNGSYRMLLQMSSRSTSCWSMLSHRVHLVVPWICKAQTAYILRSQELGETLRRC